MSAFISYFLILYFIIFFGMAVFWRNYSVYKKTGSNAFKLNNKKCVESITNRYFKILPMLSILVLALYTQFPTLYNKTGIIFFFVSSIWQMIGILIMSLALIFVVVAQSQMGTSWRIGIDTNQKTELITSGIFSISRNPIFIGIIFSSLGYFLVLPNAITLTILTLDIALIQVQVALEEKHLNDIHGDDYKKYCDNVRRWL